MEKENVTEKNMAEFFVSEAKKKLTDKEREELIKKTKELNTALAQKLLDPERYTVSNKFIRAGSKIFIFPSESAYSHAYYAAANGIEIPDDAGKVQTDFIRQILHLNGDSTTLEIYPQNNPQAREDTIKIAKELLPGIEISQQDFKLF